MKIMTTETDLTYEVGEWIKFDPGNGHERPAMVTDIEGNKVSLMVVYKGHLDFVGELEIIETKAPAAIEAPEVAKAPEVAAAPEEKP